MRNEGRKKKKKKKKMTEMKVQQKAGRQPRVDVQLMTGAKVMIDMQGATNKGVDLIRNGEKQNCDLPTHDGLAIVLLLRHDG